MPSSTSKTTIIDRALQILGFAGIASSQQVGSRGAKAMERAYDSTKLSELQKNYWHFAIKRAILPASATAPVHTKAYAFPLPGDYIMLAPNDQASDFPAANDWIVECGKIITDDSGPLNIRYVSSAVTEPMFDAVFAEALSAALAMMTAEELTNSTSKLTNASNIYDLQIGIARQRGSILIQKQRQPVSSWISARN